MTLLFARLTLAGALVAAVLLPALPASAADRWREVSRTAYFTVQTAKHGTLRRHDGNWHTAWLRLNGPDGLVSGAVADWTCPRGVKPNYLEVAGPWTCTVESFKPISTAYDAQGDPLLQVKVNKRTRRLGAVGSVTFINQRGRAKSGTVDIEGLAKGSLSKTTSDSADGLSRQVYAERGKTSATGKVLNVNLTARGFRTKASKLASLTLYVRTGS